MKENQSYTSRISNSSYHHQFFFQPEKISKMSYNKGDKDFGEAPKVHKIRITLTSRKPQALEKVCTELIERAKSKVSER